MRIASVIMAVMAVGILVMSEDTVSQSEPSSDTPSVRCPNPQDPRCSMTEQVPEEGLVVRTVVCYTRADAFCEIPKGAQEGKPCKCRDGTKGKSGIHEEHLPGIAIRPTVG